MSHRERRRRREKSRERRAIRRRAASRHLAWETLENRHVLTTVGVLGDGTLLVESDDASDVRLSLGPDGTIRVTDSATPRVEVDVRSGVIADRRDPQTAVVRPSLITRIDILGGGADDRVTVDFSNGSPLVGDFQFDGGGQSATGAGDALELLGGSFSTIEHEFFSANDGSVDLDGSVITYTGLEPIVDQLIAGVRTFTFLAADETILLSDDADPADNQSFIDSTAGESVEFVNPTASLIVRTAAMGGSGADRIDVQGLDADFAADVVIEADADDDIVFGVADTLTGGGSILAVAGSVDVTDGVEVATTDGALLSAGDVQFIAPTITLGPATTIQTNGGVASPGDITLEALGVGEAIADAITPTDLLAAATASIAITGATLDGDTVEITAETTTDVLIESGDDVGGSVNLAATFVTSNVVIDITGGAVVEALGDLTVSASSNAAAELTRVPEDDGDAGDDDQSEDAAIAATAVASSAVVTVSGVSLLTAGGAATVLASNVAGSTTLVDGLAGSSDAGGVVATSVLTGQTLATIEGAASLTASGPVIVRAISDRTVSATAISTTEGATEDGDAGTMTEGQQTLDDNDASTSDGSVGLAAAVAVTTLTGATQALVDAGTVRSLTNDVTIDADATYAATTDADGSSASGDSDTGVGVAVGIGVVDVDASAQVRQTSTVDGNNVTLSGTITSGAADVSAMSGPSGDAEGADVGVAGALAINTVIADATAAIDSGATVAASGSNLAIEATSTTSATSTATPLEDGVTGESVGVGASVALNIADHSTIATVGENATLNGGGALSINAVSDHTVVTSAESAAAGGTAIAAVVATTIANEDTRASIGDGAALSIGGGLTVSAAHDGVATTTATGDAEGGEDAAIGAALALSFVNETTEAIVDRDVDALGAIAITATGDSASTATASASAAGAAGEGGGDPDVDSQATGQRDASDQAATDRGARTSADSGDTPTASTSDGAVTVAAAVAINLATASTLATISDGRNVSATGLVVIAALADADAAAMADASATGADSAGVGAAVAVNRLDVDNVARVGENAVVEGLGLTIDARMEDDGADATHVTDAGAVAGAGDGDVGVAGAVAINLVDTLTVAEIASNAQAELAGGLLAVRAAATTDNGASAAPEGDGGQGEDVGIGGSFAFNRIDNVVTASIGSGAAAAGAIGSLAVEATGDHTVATDSQNGAAGDVGIGLAAAVAIVNNQTTAELAARRRDRGRRRGRRGRDAPRRKPHDDRRRGGGRIGRRGRVGRRERRFGDQLGRGLAECRGRRRC